MVLRPRIGLRQPQVMTTGSPGQEVKKLLVLAQHPLLPVLDQRIENTVARKQLPRIFFNPQPRPHLQGQGQEYALIAFARFAVQMVPQVPMRQVLLALGLKGVAVVAV